MRKLKLVLVFCVSVLIINCSARKETYQEVAKKYIIALSAYIAEQTQDGYDNLSELTSQYTMQLILREVRRSSCTESKVVEYEFVRDSISSDEMWAWVWYENKVDTASVSVMKVQLRQSLSGWVVDQPII